MTIKAVPKTTNPSLKTRKTSQGCRYSRFTDNILELIGNTPMLKLNKLTANVECTILAKLEFLNLGGSIKDRIGKSMIELAEKQGLIKPGYTIVEPTSGNTGIGLAVAAIAKGYKMVFTLPDKMSKEKIDLLKAFGAKLIITPTAVPPDHPANYVRVAERIVKETPNSFMPNQYFNPSNPEAHFRTTGPEIWEQTEGKVDVLVATMGTGGTISGIGKYLKEKNPNIRIVGVDPEGSIYHHEFYGTKGEVHPYKVEGIGEDFLPSTLNLKIMDEIITVTDKEAFLTARELAQKEGIFAGGSAGAAVFAALKVARKLKKDQTIVVILPDTGRNYLNKIYSDEWMIENGFLEGKDEEIVVADLLSTKPRKIKSLISVEPEDDLNVALQLMKKYGVSQLPVVKDKVQVESIREITLMKHLSGRKYPATHKVSDFMEEPLPSIGRDDKIVAPLKLMKDRNAMIVLEKGKIIDIITTIDIVNYFLKR